MITLEHKTPGHPLYWQIYEQIKRDIHGGVLAAEEKLPSKRKLAASLGVSVTTVDAAYAQLVSEGFLSARPQRGFFVCPLEELKKSQPRPAETEKAPGEKKAEVDFSSGAVDPEHFPYNTWRRLLKNAFNEYDEGLLRRTPPQGDWELRRAIAAYLYDARGVHCTADSIIIGAGAEHLLQVLSYILENSCTIAMENPVYNRAYQIFQRMGHGVLPVDIDGAGMPVEPLADKQNIAVYVTPSHQFPLGVSMPISRRIKLLRWAEAGKNRYIIEDDYDSEFRYLTRPLPSLQSIDDGGKVIYLGTFTKSIAPSLRIGFLVLPPALLSAYKEEYAGFGSLVSRLEQRVLCEFIRGGYFERHLNKMRTVYRGKRALLERALRGAFGPSLGMQGENAGHHLLVSPGNGMSESELCAAALERGVRVYPISPYFIREIPAEHRGQVLLGYGGLSGEEIEKGVALLKQAWGMQR